MIYLISGGVKSHKSKRAESIAGSFNGEKLYIATMENKSEESKIRIEKHRLMRKDKNFHTLEIEKDFEGMDLSCFNVVLLECLGNLCANHLFNGGSIEGFYKDMDYLMKNAKNLVIVTNDISYDGLYYSKEVQDYIKTLNNGASYIAERADSVIEMVYGNMIIHKGSL